MDLCIAVNVDRNHLILTDMENDNSAMWAMLNNQGVNNPLWLLALLIFGPQFARGNWGCDGGNLAQTIADNHNTDLLMGNLKANSEAARSLAGQLNVGVDSINAAIAGLGSMMQNCCCEQKTTTLKSGYENQIGNLMQSNAIQAGFSNTNGILAKGFADIGYASQAQTCELKTNQNENTQRIIDTMNAHWNSDLQQRYNDVRLEMSQLKQNATLIAALKKTAEDVVG